MINITASNAMTLLTPEEKLSVSTGQTPFGQAIEPAGSVLATSVCGVAGALAATVMAGASVAVIAVLAFLLSVRLGIHNMDAFLPESAQGFPPKSRKEQAESSEGKRWTGAIPFCKKPPGKQKVFGRRTSSFVFLQKEVKKPCFAGDRPRGSKLAQQL